VYDIVTNGIADFLARRPGLSRAMRRQPLAGLVDGSNKIFLCPLYPILSTGLKVYLDTTLQTLTTHYTVDTASGTITFVSAPSVQPTADYTAIQLSDQQIVYYTWAGAMLMEALWSRKYALSSSNTAYAFASPTDAHIYLCQGPLAAGAVPVDPVIGTLTFSTSQVQRGWLSRCAELAYVDSMMVESALSDINVRERVGGVAITTDHRSANIRQAREALWNEVVSAMYAALDEFDSTGAHYGKIATPMHTEYYTDNWNWQNNSGILVPSGINSQWW